MTRIDIAYVVQVLSQFMHNPKQSHMNAALRVVKYIKNAPGLGLLMPSDSSGKFAAYCDSDWGGCLQTRRSVTGYLVKFGNAIVSWKSKKQETVARSSAEAEFRSMASVVAESCINTKENNTNDVKIQDNVKNISTDVVLTGGKKGSLSDMTVAQIYVKKTS
uniref:Reverse transcriptase Ty1/copia-type domain-containing protein n=1 Tax=Solanum lycopersicum TaxID=4081 RepID=A0A3Q7I177_SOLLC